MIKRILGGFGPVVASEACLCYSTCNSACSTKSAEYSEAYHDGYYEQNDGLAEAQ